MKLCGCKEECFSDEDQVWGHLSGVMCFHLSETDKNISICDIDKELVNVYSTDEEYKELGGIA